ncbi:glycosyltransferase family 4 protein [Cyclobacterium roseum]|uniref:glycosyltransferase family 4 protein n=1 Tax=Cyclobacterium roseum TaxID=2666137 RepID=UPI001390CC72|nr:glycosyltransferase family 4 protein [Cyclobacterium roseum]
MIRVLHIFNELKYSGAEIMYSDAIKFFKEKNIEIIIVSTGKKIGEFKSQFENQNIKVLHWPINNIFNIFSNYRKIYNYLKTEKIDVLHVHRNSLYLIFLVGKLAGIKIIKTQHNNFQNKLQTRFFQIFTRAIFRKYCNTTYQTIGESVYNNELEIYHNPSKKINNWIDLRKFYPETTNNLKNEIKEKLSISKDSFVIISTGGCTDIKNHADIIKSMPIINEKINCVYIHLGIGEMEFYERKLALELNVFNSIRFLGNKSNVRELLISADLFVMTSKFEGLSIASIEAMACKIPVILYDSPGLRDLIKDNDNGFLIESNYKVLAQTVISCYFKYKAAKEKADNAFKLVLNEYRLEKNIKSIIDLYQ